jgi:hypothetical protein
LPFISIKSKRGAFSSSVLLQVSIEVKNLPQLCSLGDRRIGLAAESRALPFAQRNLWNDRRKQGELAVVQNRKWIGRQEPPDEFLVGFD